MVRKWSTVPISLSYTTPPPAPAASLLLLLLHTPSTRAASASRWTWKPSGTTWSNRSSSTSRHGASCFPQGAACASGYSVMYNHTPVSALAHADMTTLPKVDTSCTALSLMPTLIVNTVRSFSTHGHQSAAKGSSSTVSRRSDIRLILTF